MQVVSVVSGIFFKAKIEETVRRFGKNAFCSSLEEIGLLNPRVIIVDLEHPDALEVLRRYGRQVIAFGPHLRTDLLTIASQFGARAYPRSIFFNQLDQILHLHE